jgi:hypothetical protein
LSAEAGRAERSPEPARLAGRTFGAERVILDGGTFVDCAFEGSTLVYFGGGIPEIDRCRLTDVRFEFEGPAKNTVELLRWLRAQSAIDF